MAPKLVNKITPRDVVGELPRLDVKGAENAPRVLYDLFGVARKYRTGKGKGDKDWVQFIGDFRAVTPEGEMFAAPRCHVPGVFEDALYARLAEAMEAGEGSGSVEFAIRVSIVPPKGGKPSATGYEFSVTPLVEPAESDAMLALSQRTIDAAKALPAPAKAKK